MDKLLFVSKLSNRKQLLAHNIIFMDVLYEKLLNTLFLSIIYKIQILIFKIVIILYLSEVKYTVLIGTNTLWYDFFQLAVYLL